MSWRPLDSFTETSIPKLGNLRRAKRSGLRVPTTVWSHASELRIENLQPPQQISFPLIVRSASPTEDLEGASAAGQFVSLEVEENDLGGFRDAVRAVRDSLPLDDQGVPTGAVFVQPRLRPERGGVAFFDGFYFERTTNLGGNQQLTAGTERGVVERGQLARNDKFSSWLRDLERCFATELARGNALDVEFAQDGEQFTLLQARPARFPLKRDPLLSLANHREILGELPSPWIVSALEIAGRDALGYFAEVDPTIRDWDEQYAVALGGRAWLNFSFFFRLMDHWGLPRTFVTEGVGGSDAGPEDARADLPRMVLKSPRLVRLQLKNLATIRKSPGELARFDAAVASARTCEELFRATVLGLSVALRTNFAINGALTGLTRVRKALGIRGRARVTTEVMMERYAAIRDVPSEQRAEKLDAWLGEFGHRGPLESDPARPRFAELRPALLADLQQPIPPPPATAPVRESRGPLFALDRRRESFRDELMRIWQKLRTSCLKVAREQGFADPEDIFLLRSGEVEQPSSVNLEQRRDELRALAEAQLPSTASRSEIEAALEQAAVPGDESRGESFSGVPLGEHDFEGRVQRAEDLVALLAEEQSVGHPLLDTGTVLVVPALEPSWAVVFPRVGAVVTELGGELSHASILLREAGKPAIVNCTGAFASLASGDRVRLDSREGRVLRVS